MRIISRNQYLVNESRAQSLDSAPRRLVVRVTRNGDGTVKRTDEQGDGATCLERVTVTPKLLEDFKSEMSSSNSNVLRIADTKIDVAHLRAIDSQDTEMVKRDEAARGFAGHNFDEAQQNFT